jgi:hypothetical protein
MKIDRRKIKNSYDIDSKLWWARYPHPNARRILGIQEMVGDVGKTKEEAAEKLIAQLKRRFGGNA